MFFSSWLRNLKAPAPPARRDRQQRWRPRIETLEDRTVPSAVSFSPPIYYDFGSAAAGGLAVGDFNGDGTPDLAVSDFSDNKITVLLGNGDGTFRNAGVLAVYRPESMATGDFYGDGKIDLVAPPGIFLGNGDGTFRSLGYFTGAGGQSLQAIDLNGDGKLDLVSVTQYRVNVALGNGDGTFQNRSYSAGYVYPASVAVADFNGDGKLDLVDTGEPAGGIFDTTSVLLGNGDGTFQQPRTIPIVWGAYSVVAGDFNGDGRSDLVVGSRVLLGNGDGTFQSGQDLGYVYSVVVADFNGDGKPDLASTQLIGGSGIAMHLGNGDGTFQAAQNFGPQSYGLAVADFNGDGKPDVIVPNGDTIAALLNALGTTTAVTGPNSSTYGQPAAYTATVTSDGAPVTAGSLTFMDDNVPVSPPLPLDGNGHATFSIASLRTGNHTITASYSGTQGGAGTTGFGPSTSTIALTVNPAPLSATAVNVTSTAGAPAVSTTVATFTNADPFGSPAWQYYRAYIDWGDGSRTVDGTADFGIITGTGILTVSGSHTYADAGSYTMSVTISHVYGYTTTATVSPTATVTSLGLSVQRGLAGDIGFWHGGSGQVLINSFNGGPNATGLGTWLANNFSNLYGFLGTWTNADVAAFYQSQFAVSGPNAQAQVLATALNVYATTRSLGGTAGQAYGFTVTDAGLGAYSFNAGSDGEAFRFTNNSTHTVYAFLKAVDRDPSNIFFSDSLRKEVNDLFDALNKAGRI